MLQVDKKIRADLIGAAVVIALGAAWAWEAGDYGYVGDGGRLAAGTLPALAGATLIACGLAVLVMALVRARTTPANSAQEERDRWIGPTRPRRNESDARRKGLLLLGGLLACLVVAPLLGFTTSFAILTFLVVMLLEGRSPIVAAACAVAVFAFGFLVFQTLLQVPLP